MNKHFKIFLPFLLVGFMAGCDAKNEANNQPQDDEQGQVTPQANTVTITVADKVYDGQAIQASATASSGAQVSLSYKKASEADSAYSADAPKNAGEYTIKAAVAASADYEAGFATKNFTISQKEISLQWNSPADLVYDGQPKVPSLGLIGIIEGDTVNVTTALTAGMSNINVGTFTFEVSLIDNANYKLPQNVVSPEYTIAKANPTYQVPTGLTAIYGEKLADVELPSGFSWQEDANTSVGNVGDNNFHLIYTPSDTVNYVTVRDIPVSITVSKGSPTYTTPTGLTATYGQTLADVVLPTGFAWEDPTTTSVGTAGEHQFMVSFTPTDTANLNVAEHIPVTILVNKANPAYTLPTDLTATYGQHLSDIALPAGFAWADPSQSVGAVGNHQFNVVYTPEDTANYNVVSDLPVSIAVGKANSTVPVLAPIQVVYGKRLSEIELPAELSWPEGQNLNQIPDAGNNYYVVSYQEDENHEVVDNVELLVVVSKAVPTYVLPENITLTFGNRLSDYLLPGGFSWQEDANTLVGDAGHHTFHLVYTPEDIYNYSVVSNIEVEVIVEKADGSINIDASNMSKKWDGQPVSAPSVAYAGEGAPTIYYKLDSSEQEWVTTAPSEVGDYFVYATFEDNNHSLATSSTETFSITKADQNITIDTIGVFKPSDNFSNDDVHYTRLGTGAVTIEYRDINATDDDYSTTVPVVSGTYRVRVSAAADDHYNAGFAVSNMTISDKDVPEVTINKVYTFGEETLIYKKGYFIMTDFTVRANGEVLENSQFGRGIRYRYEGDSDYQYSDSTKMENMPNGHYYIQVFVSFSDVSIKDNYTSVYVYGEFDYAKAVPTYTVPTNKTATYGQTFANITDQVVTGCIGYDANGQFFVENDLNETVGNAGEQTIYVTYRRTTSDADHYEVVEHIPLTLTVSKADPDYSWIPSLTVQYNQRYGDVELPEGWSWQSPNNINTAYPNSTFQATFRYAGDDNHIAMNNVTRYIMSVQGYVPYAIEGLDANANQLNIIYSGKPVTFSLTSNVGDGNGADIVVVSPNAGQCSYQYKRDGAPESSYTINAPSKLGL